MPDGSLEEMAGVKPPRHGDDAEEEQVIFLAHLLGLLLLFVGETLTLSLVRDMWPDIDFDDCDFGEGRKA
jgi:hypothetical protein